jgi:hypothetical protein
MKKNTSDRDRMPNLPARLEAERFVLGSILVNHELFPQADRLEPSDFSLRTHQRIFARMRDLYQRGELIDRCTVYLELRNHHEQEPDSLSYLVDLDYGLPQLPNIGHYVSAVVEASQRRRAMYSAQALMLGAEDMNQQLPALLSVHRKYLAVIDERGEAPMGELEQIPSVWRAEVQMSFLVEDLLLEAGVTMLSGESGDGKSTFALALAGAVAQGQLFLGRRTEQRPVLYLDRENPVFIVKDRLYRLQIPEIPDQLKIWGTWWDGHNPPGPAHAAVLAFARKAKPLIVFDSLIAFGNCDENSSNEMRAHMRLYRNLAALGATVLIIHHRSDKGQSDYRGSSDIRANVDGAYVLTRDDGSTAADRLGRLLLRPYKTRGLPEKSMRLEFGGNAFLPVDAPLRRPSEIIKELVRTHPGATQKELRNLALQHGLGDHPLRDALDAAVLGGEIIARRGSHNTLRYYLPEADFGGLSVV